MIAEWSYVVDSSGAQSPDSHLTTVFPMPILRPFSREQLTQKTDFQQSVAAAPMAMSMMIDSMVNMLHSNRQSLDDSRIEKNDN